MDDIEVVRQWCLEMPKAEEYFPFGPEPAVFRVKGKMFALLGFSDTPPSVSLKCDPAAAEALRASYPGVTAGYHLNKRHWNTIVIDGSIDGELIRAWIEDSYDLVVAGLTKAERTELAADSGTAGGMA